MTVDPPTSASDGQQDHISNSAARRWQRAIEVVLVIAWFALAVVALYGAWIYDR